jgi:hypothetical protein
LILQNNFLLARNLLYRWYPKPTEGNKMKMLKQAVGATLLMIAAASASATPTFVGSWDLYSGVGWWTNSAPTYTAQEAAAALFGGAATDYAISTTGNSVGSINNMAWYDRYGYGPGVFAENYRVDNAVIGIYDTPGDSSAMILDNAGGRGLMNYAFRLDAPANVPEPLTAGLMGAGMLGLALARRRKSK